MLRLRTEPCIQSGNSEARWKGYRAAKELNHELFITPEAGVVHVREGSTLIADRPTCMFTSLAHVLTADFLKECFWELKRDKAPGIDGVT
jgi:hypothetical protein